MYVLIGGILIVGSIEVVFVLLDEGGEVDFQSKLVPYLLVLADDDGLVVIDGDDVGLTSGFFFFVEGSFADQHTDFWYFLL